MGKWNVIIPTATTNLIANPSFEVDVTGWTVITGAITKDTTLQKFGVSCALLEDALGSQFKVYSTSTATLNVGETITISAYGYLPTSLAAPTPNIALTSGGATGTGTTQGTATFTSVGAWQRQEVSYTHPGGGALTMYLNFTASSTGKLYVDACQMEIQSTATTYIDGSLEGGQWLNVPHQSTSSRLVTDAFGGTVANFEDDLSYPIESWQGTGMTQVELSTEAYATANGSKFQALRYAERVMRLFGTSNDSITSLTSLHTYRQALVKALMSSSGRVDGEVPYKLLRYTGATVEKEIKAYLDTDLELSLDSGWHENNLPIQFISPDPFFYEIGNTAAVLDVNDSTAFNSVSRRTSGGWTDADIGSIAGNAQVWDIAWNERTGDVYIAGDFTDLDSIGANDFFVTAQTGGTMTYSVLGTTAPDAKVWRVIVGNDDAVYIAGEFGVVDGVAFTSKIAAWNGSAWVSVTGALTTGDVYDMTYTEAGLLVVGGAFAGALSIGGQNIDRLGVYNGTSWAEFGGGVDDGVVYGVATAPNGNILICGTFTTVAGVSGFNGVAEWNGTSWSNMNGGLDISAGKVVRDIQATIDGTIYAGGDSLTANGATATAIGYIARWNGSVWDDVNGGVNAAVRRMLPTSNGELVVVGDFTAKAAGTTHNLPKMAIYNGTDFLPLDMDAPTTPRAIVEIQGELWIGHGTDGSLQTAGSTTIGYTGTANAYPIIEIERSGGTSAELRSIIIEETGAALYFNSYALLNREKITINLSPEGFKLYSNFYGEIPRLLLAASDTSAFTLAAGNGSAAYNNTLSCFAVLAGSPTITATVTWRTAFVSSD